MRQAVSMCALVVLAVTSAAVASGTRSDPYKSLLGGAYPDIALPAAFSSAKISAAAPSPSARSHGATGAVEVDVDGPDPKDGIVFAVFKTPAAAAAAAASVVPALQGLTLHPSGKVPGIAGSALYRGTYTTVDALNDTTTETVSYAVAPQGSVLVSGFTFTSSATVGNAGGAAALLRSGRAHVRKLTGQS